MIDNSGNNMRILFHVCKEVGAFEYGTKLSRIQQDIIDHWTREKGNLFSITQIAYRNRCSRGKVQKAVRQLEKRGIVRRYCGGYKTRWNAILCDECKREFEKIDIRYFVKAIFDNQRSPSKLRPSLIQRISYDRGNPIYKQWGWQYEGRVCPECLTKLLRKPELKTIGISSVILGFREL